LLLQDQVDTIEKVFNANDLEDLISDLQHYIYIKKQLE
jgi:hypothetical protein